MNELNLSRKGQGNYNDTTPDYKKEEEKQERR
jgi:hypothetical protein